MKVNKSGAEENDWRKYQVERARSILPAPTQSNFDQNNAQERTPKYFINIKLQKPKKRKKKRGYHDIHHSILL